MKTHCCWVGLLLFELVVASPLFDVEGNDPSSITQQSNPWGSHAQLVRSKRQSDVGSILGDIFQIPIQTLTAVSQLFNTAKKQRDKRRPYQNNNNNNKYNNNNSDDDDDNYGGYSSYNNGQPAKPYNTNSNGYNNGNSNSYYNHNNNNKFGSGQSAYNNGYNGNNNNNGNNRPSYNNNNNNNNIGSNAFSKPSSSNSNNNYNGNIFNRPLHYLSQLMNALGNSNSKESRTQGAVISGLTTAADGSGFKI